MHVDPRDVALLARHRPVIRYDRFEPYPATDVRALLELGAAAGVESVVELVRDGETIPYARGDGVPGPGDLLRAPGAGRYPDGVAWSRGDRLRMIPRGARLDRRRDGAVQHDLFGHVVYGRVAERPDGLWLQYWFFHVGNDRVDPHSARIQHEGDWEMVQLRLPRRRSGEGVRRTPDLVTFSQHHTAARRRWRTVRRVGERIVVHPGRGTHALYPRPTRWGSWAFDMRDGGYEVRDVRVEPLDEAAGIARWPGRWGGQGRSSPEGLAHRPAWTDPLGHHRAAEGLPRALLRALAQRLRSAVVALGRRGERARRAPADLARAVAAPAAAAEADAARPRRARQARLPWPARGARRAVHLERDPDDPATLVLSVVIRDFGWSLSVHFLLVRVTSDAGGTPRVYTWTVPPGVPGEGFRFRAPLPWPSDPARGYAVEVRAMPATAVGQLRVGTAAVAAGPRPPAAPSPAGGAALHQVP